jgi:glycerol-3-phosphate dehydrogenase
MKSDYDVSLDGPKIISKSKLLKSYPNVKDIHGKYGVILNEAQMMDGRMTLHALLTSSIDSFIPGMKGATLANYVEFSDFIKNAEGNIEGAVLIDRLTKKQFTVKSRVVVNAAGVHADIIR